MRVRPVSHLAAEAVTCAQQDVFHWESAPGATDAWKSGMKRQYRSGKSLRSLLRAAAEAVDDDSCDLAWRAQDLTEERAAENQSCMETLGSGVVGKWGESHGRSGANETGSEGGSGGGGKGAAWHSTSKEAAAAINRMFILSESGR